MKRTQRRARTKGVSLIELCVGLIVLLPVIFTVFDLAVIVIALQTNDSACREAARLAASGDPQYAGDRALAAVARAQEITSSLANNYQLLSCVISIPPTSQAFPTTPSVKGTIPLAGTAMGTLLEGLQATGGQATGSITVTTQVDIYPFVVHWAYGGVKPLQFGSAETYPFSYTYPPPPPPFR